MSIETSFRCGLDFTVVMMLLSTMGLSVAGFSTSQSLSTKAKQGVAVRESYLPYHTKMMSSFEQRIVHRNLNERLYAAITSESSEVAKPSEKVPKNVPTARSVAVSALVKGKSQSGFSLQRLDVDPSFLSLADQRDRSFARLLVTTVERRMGQIDKVLEQCQNVAPTRKKKQSKDDALVHACLRVGAAQLLFLDVPQYAAVKETIDVLRLKTNAITIPESKIKYANAILRRITREGPALLAEHTSPENNISPWLLEEWTTSWGNERTAIISASLMKQHAMDLSINYPPGTWSTEERMTEQRRIQSQFGDDTEILPHGSLRVGESVTGSVSEWPLYAEGAWWVQDASAALPALALYNALSEQNVSTMHVVDMCSAPGGKTAQLVSLGFGHVTSVESSERRSRRLSENLLRLNMDDRCAVCVADGTEWLPKDGEQAINGVLLDVPCSATGTGSKQPDVLRRDENLGNLLEVQERLATHCADNLLTPGGVMVYATCSLLKRESEDQVQKLLSHNVGTVLETVPFIPGEIPGFDDAIDENGWLRVLPGVLPGSLSSCDGFFVARLRRVQ